MTEFIRLLRHAVQAESSRGKANTSATTIKLYGTPNDLSPLRTSLRSHIACHNLTVRVPLRIGAQNLLTATTRAGSQRLRVFRFVTNDRASLQNPKTLALPVAIRYRPDVAAASRSFSRPHRFSQCQFRCAFTPLPSRLA
jgi:hypothetical protein